MKLALISHGSPGEPRHFSGIPWHVLRELRRRGHEVEPFHAEPTEWARRRAQVQHRLSLKFTRQPHNFEADPWILRTRSRRVAAQILAFAPEAVLCVGFPEAALALPSRPPIYIWMDAFYPSVRRLYPYFRIYYSERDARALQRMEDGVLRRSRKIWLSSEWAAEEARQDFPDAAARIGVQSFGANLEEPPSAPEVEKFIKERNLQEPTLLFLANEWERKGGDAAVETVRRLRARGCPAKLSLVGIKAKPTSLPEGPWLEWIGPLDKNQPAEARRLQNLLAESAFLLLPSTADCTPIVCHEAAAYGLPVLATEVGGLPSTVTAGETGMLWPVAKFAEEAPAWIVAALADRPRYELMARAGRRRFETTGNWAVNVGAVAAAIATDKI
jgi:glycosyltransferase involved in cell wall biosynthesis